MQLADFDITKQLPQDLMHVILEGIFPFHIEQLLKYILEQSLITLSEINSRISSFPFAYFNTKPTPLSNCELQGTQSGILLYYYKAS